MKPPLGKPKNWCLQNKGHGHAVTRTEATHCNQRMLQKGQSMEERWYNNLRKGPQMWGINLRSTCLAHWPHTPKHNRRLQSPGDREQLCVPTGNKQMTYEELGVGMASDASASALEPRSSEARPSKFWRQTLSKWIWNSEWNKDIGLENSPPTRWCTESAAGHASPDGGSEPRKRKCGSRKHKIQPRVVKGSPEQWSRGPKEDSCAAGTKGNYSTKLQVRGQGEQNEDLRHSGQCKLWKQSRHGLFTLVPASTSMHSLMMNWVLT